MKELLRKSYCGSLAHTLTRFIVYTASAGLLISCSSVNLNTYRSPELDTYRIRKVVIMPMIITAGASTQVAGSYSPDWISETFTTQALSPAEYYPAEKELVKAVSEQLEGIKIIDPALVQKAMRERKISTYMNAIIAVANEFKADAVISFKIRDMNLRAGSQIEGRAAAIGHADLTVYSPSGDALLSISSEAVYRKGSAFSSAPSLASFVKFIMRKYEPEMATMIKK